METLGLYPLSVVLSFLSETDGGVALLLTHRRFARRVLPLFRTAQPQQPQQQQRQHRHRFKVAPVQDPAVLLERLNTRRLAQRRRRRRTMRRRDNNPQQQQQQQQRREEEEEETCGLSTVELAHKEWNEQTHCGNNNSNNLNNNIIPPELELLRFMDPTHRDDGDVHCRALRRSGVTLLASYPRSGNTLLRTLLERATGFVTGSDTRPDRSLSRELAERHGLVGEGVAAEGQHDGDGCCGYSCPFVKTHWPERAGNRPFAGNRAVLLVRNPYDAMDSYWNMNATKSHTRTLQNTVYQQYRDVWDGLVRSEIHVWARFLEYWVRDCPVPVLLVRYEDLVRDPAGQLACVLEFAFQQQPLDEFWKRRVARAAGAAAGGSNTGAAANGTESLGSYRPRTAARGPASIGKSLRQGHYSAELLDYIHAAAAGRPHGTNYLRALGYDMVEQGFPHNFNSAAAGTGTAAGTAAAAAAAASDDGGTSTAAFPEAAAALTLTTQMHHELLQSTSPVVRVNSSSSAAPLVRPSDCPYGRLMYRWRHSVTETDTVPLPTEG